MKAGVFHGERDIRVEEVEDSRIVDPTDAVVRVVRSSVCGSDLWSYRGITPGEAGGRTGHEVTGIVEAIGDDVATVAVGDTVVVAFLWACGACEFCRNGLQTSCRKAVFPGGKNDGGQAEYQRVQMVDGTAWKVPDGAPEERLDSIHLLSDVLLTGYHAAKLAGVGSIGFDGEQVRTAVVIGDGAVGLSGVMSAKLLGATTIVACGHHEDRLQIATQFGATHTTSLSGRELTSYVREITDGGAPAVLECVGATSSMMTAGAVVRGGGAIGAVGVPNGVESLPLGHLFGKNAALRMGVAPTRAYIDEVGPLVVSGEIDPSPLASHRFGLDELPRAFEAMDKREAIKAIIAG